MTNIENLNLESVDLDFFRTSRTDFLFSQKQP